MYEFKVGDTVCKASDPSCKGKVISTTAYGGRPLVISWENGGLSDFGLNTYALLYHKEPRVVYINEYYDVGISCNAYHTEEEAQRRGTSGERRRILKFVEVIE